MNFGKLISITFLLVFLTQAKHMGPLRCDNTKCSQ